MKMMINIAKTVCVSWRRWICPCTQKHLDSCACVKSSSFAWREIWWLKYAIWNCSVFVALCFDFLLTLEINRALLLCSLLIIQPQMFVHMLREHTCVYLVQCNQTRNLRQRSCWCFRCMLNIQCDAMQSWETFNCLNFRNRKIVKWNEMEVEKFESMWHFVD